MNKIKLNKLAQNAMKNKEMNNIKGGNYCECGCKYAGNGGSSIDANMNANYSGNLISPGGWKARKWDEVLIYVEQ